jgi:hypothetical protein
MSDKKSMILGFLLSPKRSVFCFSPAGGEP